MSKEDLAFKATLDLRLDWPSNSNPMPEQLKTNLSLYLSHFPETLRSLITEYLFCVIGINLAKELLTFIRISAPALDSFDDSSQRSGGVAFTFHYMEMLLKILEVIGYGEIYQRTLSEEQRYLPQAQYIDPMVALRILLLMQPPPVLMYDIWLGSASKGFLFVRIMMACQRREIRSTLDINKGHHVFTAICQLASLKYNIITPLIRETVMSTNGSYQDYKNKLAAAISSEEKVEILKSACFVGDYHSLIYDAKTGNYGSIFSIKDQKKWNERLKKNLPVAVKLQIKQVYEKFLESKIGWTEWLLSGEARFKKQKELFCQVYKYVQAVKNNQFDPIQIKIDIQENWSNSLRTGQAHSHINQVLDILNEAAKIIKDCQTSQEAFKAIKEDEDGEPLIPYARGGWGLTGAPLGYNRNR